MAKHDPTDDVLATIARIFEHAEATKAKPAMDAKPLPERMAIVNPFAMKRDRASVTEPQHPVPSAAPPELPSAAVEVPPASEFFPAEAVADEIETHPVSDEPASATPGADGYTRVGPGPLEAIRFRWTARADGHGGFFVDETIGAKSRAIVSGPMSSEDAIAFIDLQVQEAFERFERLKQSAAELPTQREAQAVVEQVHAEHDASEDQGF